MTNYGAGKMSVRMLMLIAVSACVCIAQTTDEAEWNRIRETKSETELLAFMEKYPQSKFAAFASRRIDLLAWEKVDKKDPEAIKRFLRAYPDLEVELPATLQGAITLGPHKSVESKTTEPAAPANIAQNVPARAVETATSAERTSASRQSEGIDKALRELTLAYENKSVDGIRTIWPTISQDVLKKVQQAFRDASSIKMTLAPTSPALVEGSTAIAICRRTLDTVYDGRSNILTSLVSIKLRRIGQEWVIESIQ